MLKPFVISSLIAGLGVSQAFAETLQLKDRASITGKILAEKRDHVAVDIGYTVLMIPRNQIEKIIREKKGSAPAQPETGLNRQIDLYHVTTPPPPERSVTELVRQFGEAVVQVRTPGGLGSGFILNEEGYLITNFHVIEGEAQISVEVYHQKSGQLERRTYKRIQIVAMNKYADLALLRIVDEGAPRFAYVPLGDTERLAVGDRVFAVGSPLGLERTVTEGIVSTKTRELQGALYLQTSAQINPGNSGGPLLNLRGEVVGVTSMKSTVGEGIGFAIPVDGVKYFLTHRDAYAYDKENPNNPHRYLPPPSRLKKTETPVAIPTP